MRPFINESLCDICCECISICPYDVFILKDNKISLSSPEDCIECLSCVKECQKQAIYIGD